MRPRQEGHQDKKMLKEVNFEEEKQVKDKLRLKSDASVKLGILIRNVVIQETRNEMRIDRVRVPASTSTPPV